MSLSPGAHSREYFKGLLLSNCSLFFFFFCNVLDIKTMPKRRGLIAVYRKTDICANEMKLGGAANGSRVRKK